MGCGNSVQRPVDVSARKDDRLPPVHKKPHVPRMVRADLERTADDRDEGLRAPTRLPALDTQLSRNAPYELTSPNTTNNAPTKDGARGLPSVFNGGAKGIAAQTSLSNSTQQRYGLSDNMSQRSDASLTDDEWYPREFGPVVTSFCGGGSSLRRKSDVYGSFHGPYGAEDDDRDVFYRHFLQLNGAMRSSGKRTPSAKELIHQKSDVNARLRLLMGTEAPAEGEKTSSSKSRVAAARELGPVDADRYLDALYERSRERERTHFFIDPDGEIRRLYHTDGWHLLGSSRRRRDVLQRRSSSTDSAGSRRGHRSKKGSGSSSSGHVNARPPVTAAAAAGLSSPAAAKQRHSSECGIHSPAEQLGGAAGTLRNTRFGSSGMLSSMTATARTAAANPSLLTPVPPAQPQSRAHTYSRGAATSPVSPPSTQVQVPPPKSTSPPAAVLGDHHGRRVRDSSKVELSGSALSLGSGRASTVPASRSAGSDFFSQAFGGGTVVGGGVDGTHTQLDEPVTANSSPSPPTPAAHIPSILMKPDGDFSSSASRRPSFNGSRRDEEGADATDSPTPRRRMSTRRVSFSQGTKYFKKDPFYVTPRSERESEYDDLTPPQTELQVQGSADGAASAVAPITLAAPRPEASSSYAQLTLLKDKMTQNRERQVV